MFTTLVAFTACDNEESAVIPSVTFSSSSESVIVNEEGNSVSARIESAGGEIKISVDSSVDWYAETTDANWVALLPSGNSLSIVIPSYNDKVPRTTRVDVKNKADNIALGSISVTQSGDDSGVELSLSVELNDEDEHVFFIGDGGEYTVQVLTDQPWATKTDVPWIQIDEDHEANLFTVTASPNITFSQRSAAIVVSTGTGLDNQISIEVPVLQLWTSEAMVLTVRVDETTDNTTTLPFYDLDDKWSNAVINCVVDWGNGKMQHVLTPIPTHQYEEPGTYVVRIYGKVESFATNIYELGQNQDMKNTIIAVNSWGNVGLRSIKYGFTQCRNLEYIAEPGKDSFADLVSAYQTFNGCESLQEAPHGFFMNAPKLEDAYGVFQATTSLKAAPDSLFAGLDNLTRVTRAFWRSGIQTIGKDMFVGCTVLEDVGQAFYQTTNITSIPHNIFDDNVNITKFPNVFNGCTGVEGESPYTMVNGEKVHLYERVNYPEIFAAPRTITNAFLHCTKLSDYDAIFAAGWAGK